MIILLMGVSGSGKTTIGRMLSGKVGLPFYDADDFHPKNNVEKMKAGIPLNDQDRVPWLETLSEKMVAWEENGGAILACSALKASYRKMLRSHAVQMRWFFLKGDEALIAKRMKAREGHYMPASLLSSQLETLEPPKHATIISIDQTPENILEDIMSDLKNNKAVSSFGIIGMGVMGSSLALNLAEKDVKISVYNRTLQGVEEDVAQKLVDAHPEVKGILPFDKLDEFVESLEQPRKILMMIPAGQIVDQQIARLLTFVDKGDVIIDGGNSFFEDSAKRQQYLQGYGIHFVGMGISGGRDGALKGPSLMPGGSEEGFELIKPYLEKIAGKDKGGKPCMHYVGPDGAGHFIKMVHNSIEYGEIQVLAELYGFMRKGLGMSIEEMVKTFKTWSKEGADSYLMDATLAILSHEKDGKLLLDGILDVAGQTGTGGWAVSTAAKYGVPYAPLTAAVTARLVSTHKEARVSFAQTYPRKTDEIDQKEIIDALKGAYDMARLVNHEIGFSLIKKVGEAEKWGLNMSEIARCWTNGSIIQSSLMEKLAGVFKSTDCLMASAALKASFENGAKTLAEVVGAGLKAGIAMPVMSAAINFFYGMSSGQSSANLVQALRDCFGEHGYRLVDDVSGKIHRNKWRKSKEEA
ncbi:NADP-dependent phosphogluconate dehydrogenase [Echinicola vietnamensis]|uniref:6-phosphogluconate dehydrogenase, decarboxylating n=1 Tax=Echinicola vietnamensis (strain DSM 17526 / LMG 23754 / KMM 6221) TaxID=926556 RepID=L0FUQ6_ECHVK|nr:NADP-dependent phosphogluconate dehydrogenase [Echinicola vietnamensis]AGA76763.1 6-phosphogluconate dehydrogenase, decarboxylating [Echinicola vietnamensis DSM 17526]